MKEELLYFIWHLQYFDKQSISTTQGEPLQILSRGVRNEHSGPDFDQARIHMGGIEWIGSVEIHVKSSDWNTHQHQYDEAYNRVVLHVVWQEDQSVYRQDGTLIPTLVLSDLVDDSVLDNYRQLVFEPSTRQAIACASQLPQIDDITKLSMLEKTAVLRLVRKSEEVENRHRKNRGDWTRTAYQTLVRSFGFNGNADPFEQLSYAAPLSLIIRYQDDFNTLAALLLGQAGLLDDEEWPSDWQKTYTFLSAKHQLATSRMSRGQWRFFRTRPANFPTIRIVQLANVLARCSKDITHVFSRLSLEQYFALFSVSGEDRVCLIPVLGKESIYKILINAIAPYQFAYGEFFHDQHWKDHALLLLQSLPPEKNHLVSKYRKYGYPLQSAFDTQAVLELHHSFCQKKRCLSCTIGGSIVKNNKIVVTSASH